MVSEHVVHHCVGIVVARCGSRTHGPSLCEDCGRCGTRTRGPSLCGDCGRCG